MNRKSLYFIVAIIFLLIFVGTLSESGPIEIFGMEINIWIYRLAWLLITLNAGRRYLAEKRLEGNR